MALQTLAEDDYYDLHNLLTRNAPWNFVIGTWTWQDFCRKTVRHKRIYQARLRVYLLASHGRGAAP